MEEFIQEIALEKPKTLEELNRKFRIWVDEGYNNSPHSGLNGDTPMHARKINKLCTACLLHAAQVQKKIIDDHMVRLIIEEEFNW